MLRSDWPCVKMSVLQTTYLHTTSYTAKLVKHWSSLLSQPYRDLLVYRFRIGPTTSIVMSIASVMFLKGTWNVVTYFIKAFIYPISKSLETQSWVIIEIFDDIRVQPSTDVLQGLWKIPVEQSNHRLNVFRQQSIDETIVVVYASLVYHPQRTIW